MLGSISGSSTSLFGALASAVAAPQFAGQSQTSPDPVAETEEDLSQTTSAATAADEDAPRQKASAQPEAASKAVSVADPATRAGPASDTAPETQAVDENGAASQAAASGTSPESLRADGAEDDALAEARAKAIATQESFVKSLVMAKIGSDAEEDGLVTRMRQGAESYAAARADAQRAEAPARASVEV